MTPATPPRHIDCTKRCAEVLQLFLAGKIALQPNKPPSYYCCTVKLQLPPDSK